MPKWRTGIFGQAPRAPMCRESRAQFKAKLLLQRRPGRLTIATAAIGRVLVDMLGPDGTLCPAISTIAEKARVSVATVKRALVQLRECGFITWTRRLTRCAASGWRTEQASSAYVLAIPACEAHFERPVRRNDFVPSILPDPAVREVSPKAQQEAMKVLAQIAGVRMRVLSLCR
jgi:hypothetical protein